MIKPSWLAPKSKAFLRMVATAFALRVAAGIACIEGPTPLVSRATIIGLDISEKYQIPLSDWI